MGERETHSQERGSHPNDEDEPKPLFELGQILGTPGAIRELEAAEQNPLELIVRHVTGDWGNLPEEDVAENERALERDLRIFSSYRLNTGKKIWLITEHDRSITTILRPQDY
jgi:hypothetical protein